VALATAAGLGALVAAAFWFGAGAAESPSELQLFVGRLHPLFVHLPIGFVLLAAVLEGLARTRLFVRARHAVPLVLVLGAASAVVAVLAGLLLASSGGYTGELVAWHRWLGVAVAVGAVGAAALRYAAGLRRSAGLRAAYGVVLTASVGGVVAAGHLGGTLARGPEYLAEYMPPPLLAVSALLSPDSVEAVRPFTYPDEAVVYEHLVAPVLRDNCVACHGPEKQKGDLRLDTPEGIREGGESGAVLAPGRAAESRMIQRIWLPPGHEDIMPPRGRQPLSVVEAELLRWWIDQGASFEQTMAGAVPPPGVRAILDEVAGPAEERVAPVLRTEVAAADSAAVAAARAAGVSLRPLARGSRFLRASCVAAAEGCGAEQLRTLLPLAPQVATLDLSGSPLTDADLATVGRLGHLTRLSLSGTRIGDAGLAHLSGLRHLEYLNLYGTAVSDAGLDALAPLTALRSLYLWQTAATPAGAERLAERLPRLRVSLGIMDPAGVFHREGREGREEETPLRPSRPSR
jgi:uncharacterized membrane protein